MRRRLQSVALGFGLALLAGPGSAAPGAAPRATPRPKPIVAPAPLPLGRARDLYSAHARRLVRSYMRLELLELRKADLERVRAVIEGKLGVDDLFRDEKFPARNDTPGDSR